MPATPPAVPAPSTAGARVLAALVVGQIGLHGAMAGLRMAAPLQALRDGWSPWAVGVLLALFAAAPVLFALHAGRMADRFGYHRPVRLAGAVVGAAMAVAVAAALVADAVLRIGLLGLAAALSGAGANLGMIAIQRTAGRTARNATERVRIFSWLGIAPSMANVVGPVGAGLLIDNGGFGAAYAGLMLLPVLALAVARQVPADAPAASAAAAPASAAWGLLAEPGLRRLLVVNGVLSACWDVHAFAVPVLGHGLGFTASTIGLILGVFTLAVTAVRVVIPLLAHRLREVTVIVAAMWGTAAVFAVYPLTESPWTMGACAVLLGLTLGAVQPMIMSTLHQVTPAHRHGEAIALRSMVINGSSTVLPLLFGLLGSAAGAGVLFWVLASALGAGTVLARRLGTS